LATLSAHRAGTDAAHWLASPAAVDPNETPGAGDNLTAFSLLGGRAAIEETLQMQNLRPVGQVEGATIDVSSLTGRRGSIASVRGDAGRPTRRPTGSGKRSPAGSVLCLRGETGGHFAFLDKGAGFAAAAGAGWTGNRLDYDLTRRYLQRLGISRPWLEAVLQSGVLQDMAVVLPDLLLIDGTDITVVARLKQPELLAALLPLAGIQGLTPDGVSTVKTSGRETSWALAGRSALHQLAPQRIGRRAAVDRRGRRWQLGTQRRIPLHADPGSGEAPDADAGVFLGPVRAPDRRTRGEAGPVAASPSPRPDGTADVAMAAGPPGWHRPSNPSPI
jgi:hypothetical protein